jgi:hypothetical protein
LTPNGSGRRGGGLSIQADNAHALAADSAVPLLSLAGGNGVDIEESNAYDVHGGNSSMHAAADPLGPLQVTVYISWLTLCEPLLSDLN